MSHDEKTFRKIAEIKTCPISRVSIAKVRPYWFNSIFNQLVDIRLTTYIQFIAQVIIP